MVFRLVTTSLLRVSKTAAPTTIMKACFATQTGTVKWFDVKKGFGFLTPDDGSNDVFVHHSSIQSDGFRSLADGEAVEYETEEDENGRLRASIVTGPNGKPVQGRPRQTYGGGGFGGGGFGDNQQGRFGADADEDDDMWKPKSY